MATANCILRESNMTYEDLIPALLTVVPELNDSPTSNRQAVEVPRSPHIFYGSVLAGRLVTAKATAHLPEASAERDLIHRTFEHIEVVACDGCEESRNVIEVSFLESLLGHPDGWSDWSPHFRPTSRRIAEHVAVAMGVQTDAGL